MLDSSEAALRSAITRALRQPDVNLNEITAKDVRSLLVEAGDLSAEEAKEKRKEIKELVGVVFWELKDDTGEGEAVDDDGVDREGAGTEVEDGGGEREGDYEEEEQLKPKKKQKKSGKSSALTDEEYARKLSDELNAGGARATRGGGGKKVTAKGAKTKKKSVKKSADLVDSDGEDGDGVTTKKRKAGGGFMKEYNLSAELSEVVSAESMSRPQVVKQLWVYIKGNNLQNPTDKREIVCDSKLKAVFGTDRINMFKMNKELGSHLRDP